MIQDLSHGGLTKYMVLERALLLRRPNDTDPDKLSQIQEALDVITKLAQSIQGAVLIVDRLSYFVINHSYPAKDPREGVRGSLEPIVCPKGILVEFALQLELLKFCIPGKKKVLDFIWTGALKIDHVSQNGNHSRILRIQPGEMNNTQAKDFFTQALVLFEEHGICFQNQISTEDK